MKYCSGTAHTAMAKDSILLRVHDLKVQFGKHTAVDGVSLELRRGETLGVVGESGSGKSTLARALLNLVPIQSGSVQWLEQEMRNAAHAQWQRMRSKVQMVFQDPLASLDPRMTAAQSIAEPLRIHEPALTEAERRQRVCDMLQRVGLNPQHLNRYPHEFSGGQCQRIGIARALVMGPELIICDEPVSALDMSIRAQIINLLTELQQEQHMALLFIAHDLAVVRHISHRVMVMYQGKVVETADRNTLFASPQHAYTQALLAAIPVPDPARARR